MRKQTLLLFLTILPLWVAAQKQEVFMPEHFVRAKDTLPYQILFPENFSEEKEYPLVLFLHGAGERGEDNQAQLTHGSNLFLGNKEFPAIVIFPQCPTGDYWASNVRFEGRGQNRTFSFSSQGEPTTSLSLVMDLMSNLLQRDYVKKDQVYVAGLSMGGMGTFELLTRMPNTFAAAIPICGGGNPENVAAFASNTALWIFHGAKDEIVPQDLSIVMAKAINEAGGTANLTIYGADGHNSWDSAFAEPNYLKWLFSQSLQKK